MATIKIIKKEEAPKQKPAYKIYQEVMKSHQQLNESTNTFIAKKQALFAQLPPPGLAVEHQLDMVYGLLHEKIRKKISRDSIRSFEGLVEAAKHVDESMNPGRANRVRCNYCRAVGHKSDDCRKKVGASSTVIIKKELEKEVVRKRSNRPNVLFEIENVKVKLRGFLSTGAAGCIASYQLYQRLKASGYKFRERRELISAAGEPKIHNVLRVNCVVKLCGRLIPTEFLVFTEPEARDSKMGTILGIDFIRRAGIVMEGMKTWRFHDNPTERYDLINEEKLEDDVDDTGLCFVPAFTWSVV